jgi:hypothetical protein
MKSLAVSAMHPGIGVDAPRLKLALQSFSRQAISQNRLSLGKTGRTDSEVSLEPEIHQRFSQTNIERGETMTKEGTEEDELDKIFDYLGLNTISDQRLKLKANIMKKVIYLCQQWRDGNEGDWIDRIANRTCVSTRKIREDYIDPLVTDEVLERAGNGLIRFAGLPSCVGQEITEKHLKEEWEEENAKRKELNKPDIAYEEWLKDRPKRFKPLRGTI